MVLRDSKVRQRRVSYREQSSLNALCYCTSWLIFRVGYLGFLQKMSMCLTWLSEQIQKYLAFITHPS